MKLSLRDSLSLCFLYFLMGKNLESLSTKNEMTLFFNLPVKIEMSDYLSKAFDVLSI